MSIQREKLNTLKFGNIVSGEKLAPVHPGEILLHDFIEPMELTRYKVAKFTNVPQRRIDEICTGNRAITADMPNRRPRRIAVSAVMARLPVQISSIRRCGTLVNFATL